MPYPPLENRPIDALRGLSLLLAVWPALGSAPFAQAASRSSSSTAADVTGFQMSPDGARVVYVADPETDEAFELYSVPTLGGPARKLNPRPVLGGDVTHYVISPDSRRVAFVGDLDADQVFELYSASITGRPPVKLSPALVAGGNVLFFNQLFLRISPDSRRIVFLADAEQDGVDELYSAPLSGGPALKLNLPLSTTGDVKEFRIAPESDRVVYLAAIERTGAYELYSVPIGGGESTKLNPPGSSVNQSYPSGFEINASKRVVFATGPHLFSAPLSGGPSVELGDSGHSSWVYFQLDPLGMRVYFVSRSDGGQAQLYSVPVAGGPSTLLSEPVLGEKVSGIYVSADGNWVLYTLSGGDEVSAVVSVPAAGGAAVELTRLSTPPYGMFMGAAITSNSKRVVISVLDTILHDHFTEESVPIQGGATTFLVNHDWDDWGYASPDSSRFVFETRSPDVGLSSMPIDGGTSLSLIPPLVPGRSVRQFLMTPDSSRIVYSADQDVQEVVELYSAPIAGGMPIQLNPEFPGTP